MQSDVVKVLSVNCNVGQRINQMRIVVTFLGRVCKSRFVNSSPYLEVQRIMRLRPKVKKVLPKIAEAIIFIEMDSLERQ